MVTGERCHGLFRNALDWSLHLLCEFVGEEMHQQRNIFGALTQRRYVNRKNIQPIVEIAAKFLVSNQFGKITVGRSDDTDIHPQSARTAQTFEFLLLQYTKEFRLQLEWDVLYLIKKYGPLICQLESSDASIHRPGECAPLV